MNFLCKLYSKIVRYIHLEVCLKLVIVMLDILKLNTYAINDIK